MWKKCKRFLADALLWLLCRLFPSEQPSETELIAYGKEMARKQGEANVWVDPIAHQRAYPQLGCYELPQRTTDPLRVPDPHGAYFLRERKRYTPLVNQETQHLPAMSQQALADLMQRAKEHEILYWEERKE